LSVETERPAASRDGQQLLIWIDSHPDIGLPGRSCKRKIPFFNILSFEGLAESVITGMPADA